VTTGRDDPALLPVYGIVGDGRMARHAAHYLTLLGLPVRQWSRRSGTPLADALADATVMLVLITDAAIPGFVERHASFRAARTTVHFSGSLSLPGIAGMHPLSTFGPDLYDSRTYAAIPFICEAEGPSFPAVFPSLPNPHFTIPCASKPLYHAGAVLAGNISAALWLKFFAILERLDIPREAAYAYLERTCRNLVELAPEEMLTGPVARKDGDTVRDNLRALGGDPYEAVYRAFVAAVAPDLTREQP
jgi:predicted short-subunit dehydrogenase-like oxidoreductase (DUF2520 family)